MVAAKKGRIIGDAVPEVEHGWEAGSQLADGQPPPPRGVEPRSSEKTLKGGASVQASEL